MISSPVICREKCYARGGQEFPMRSECRGKSRPSHLAFPIERNISTPHPQHLSSMAQSVCVRNTFLQARAVSESCPAISLHLRPSRPYPLSRSRCPPFRSPFSSVHSRHEQDEGSPKQPPLYAVKWSSPWLTNLADKILRIGPPLHRIHYLLQPENAERRWRSSWRPTSF